MATGLPRGKIPRWTYQAEKLAMTTHARLSPSSAKRWINCPASPRLIAAAPKRPTSEAAKEGTAAHALAADCLSNGLYDAFDCLANVYDDAPDYPVTREMAKAVNVYLDEVHSVLGKDTGRELFVETKLGLAHIHPDMGGTGDALVYGPATRELFVFDYKHGRGVAVDVDDNPQLMSYALGALNAVEGPRPRKITITVVQPRLAGADAIKTATYSSVELGEFAAMLTEAGARCDDPNAKPCAGDWCQFCDAAATCPALRDLARKDVELASDIPLPPIPPVALGALLRECRAALKRVKTWADAIEELAFAEACAGRMPDTFKAIEGVGRRQWCERAESDPGNFIREIGEKLLLTRYAVMEYAPKSPAQIEKLVPAKTFARVADLIEIKKGSPKLVPETAKGEPVNLNPSTAGFEAVK